MYKIVGTPTSRSVRVAWALEEIGQPYQWVIAKPRSEEITTFNPSGKIPALVDGDDCIIDSVAIMTYLADKHGQLTYPAGSIERAQQDSFTQFACDEIDGTLWTTAKHKFVLPEDKRIASIKETTAFEWQRACTTLETRLGGNTYVMGEKMTVPDIILGHCGGWAKNAGFDWKDGPVSDYFERMQASPSLAKAREKGTLALEANA